MTFNALPLRLKYNALFSIQTKKNENRLGMETLIYVVSIRYCKQFATVAYVNFFRQNTVVVHTFTYHLIV